MDGASLLRLRGTAARVLQAGHFVDGGVGTEDDPYRHAIDTAFKRARQKARTTVYIYVPAGHYHATHFRAPANVLVIGGPAFAAAVTRARAGA